MSLSAGIVWEVRATGSGNNGGGFKTGASGTDYSQQNAAQYALTGLTTAAANAIILTSSAAADMVGNIIQVTGGTNFITGFYEIISVSVGVSITVDRNCTSAAGASGAGNIGGAVDLPQTIIGASPVAVSGNKVWIKNGTYIISAALAPPAGSSNAKTIVYGYNATRGDLDTVNDYSNFPIIQNNNTGNFMIDSTTNIELHNIVCDGGSGVTKANLGIRLKDGSLIDNCKVMRWSTNQAFNLQIASAFRCLATGGASGSDSCFVGAQSVTFIGCVADNNGCEGFRAVNGGITIEDCISSNNTGVGIAIDSNDVTVKGVTIYNNSSHGITIAASQGDFARIFDCVIYSNGGYGINSSTAYSQAFSDYNAFGANTSGARNNWPTGPNDVALSADPFTNAAVGNFSLNNTAGGGAACRAAGYPGVFPGGLTTGYLDIGAVQHQDSGGGGTPLTITITTDGGGHPILTWVADPAAVHYLVLRSSSAQGAPTLIAVVAAPTVTYTDLAGTDGSYYAVVSTRG